jgi:hypothetical protein
MKFPSRLVTPGHVCLTLSQRSVKKLSGSGSAYGGVSSTRSPSSLQPPSNGWYTRDGQVNYCYNIWGSRIHTIKSMTSLVDKYSSPHLWSGWSRKCVVSNVNCIMILLVGTNRSVFRKGAVARKHFPKISLEFGMDTVDCWEDLDI